MWKAVAKYADGSTVERLFSYGCDINPNVPEGEARRAIEEWLLTRNPNCIWHSVDHFPDYAKEEQEESQGNDEQEDK